MNEIAVPISEEEYALLMIHSQGGNVADLGEHSKWHHPLVSLVSRGYLKRHDQFNHSLTTAGEAVLAGREQEEDRDLARIIEGAGAAQRHQAAIRAVCEQIVDMLVQIGKASASATGDASYVAARIWGKICIDEAAKKLGEK